MFIKPSLVKVTFFDQNPSTFSVLTNLSNCYSFCLKLVIHCDNIHQLLRPERCLLKFLVGCPRNFPKVKLIANSLKMPIFKQYFCVQRGGRAVPVRDLVGGRGLRLVLVRVSPW